MSQRKISKTYYTGLAVSGLLIFLALWFVISSRGIVPPFFMPTPLRVSRAIVTMYQSGNLINDIEASVYRILMGFLLSILFAFPVGLALGISKRFEAITGPLMAFIRYVPPSAFIPLAIIWFGIGEGSKIMLVFLGVAPYLGILVADIVKNTKQGLIEAALTLGATKKDILYHVVIPSSLPGIWDATRLMIGAAWTFVIIAEIIGASRGMGHMMIESQRFLRTDNIFAGIVIIGFIGIATDYFFKITYKILFPWTQKSIH